MSENPFTDAMDEADSTGEAESEPDGFDVDAFIEDLNDGNKTETIGVAVTEDMHALWRELRDDDDVDVDVAESIRNHLQNLAQRHPRAAEKAGRKRQIDREL